MTSSKLSNESNDIAFAEILLLITITHCNIKTVILENM